jgi:O-antigen ligase
MLARFAVIALPIFGLYLAAGWSSGAGMFRPAQVVRSLVSSDGDRSTQTRDIENYNLILTLKEDPLLGTGFGREYLETSKADDISRLFAQYRLIPHNSLLGLFSFAGLLGFWLVWLPLVVGVFLAVRAHARARTPAESTTALCAPAMVVVYSVQAFGDMGLQSWGGAVLLAAALATCSRLAVATGAWPSPQPTTPEVQRA